MEEADLTAKYTIVKYIANPMNILRKIHSNTWKQYGSEYKLDAQYAQFPFFEKYEVSGNSIRKLAVKQI